MQPLGAQDLEWKYLMNEEIPKLNIVILIAGTHGDVLPFVGFAHKLQDLGHRVRIATHECHKNTVVSRDIEFFQLKGDPKKLSDFMVQTGGSIMGAAKRLDLVPANTAMVTEIMKSTWDACTEAGKNKNDPFIADAIVSNPPTMGHIHCAEALGIPLHIMFPQPWFYPTGQFPHPMVGLSYADDPSKQMINKRSYTGWELIQFQTFQKVIGEWRAKTLKTPRIEGHMMMTTIPDAHIPFSAMWSPSFVPKPDDWPEQCRVVGTFNFQERSGPAAADDEEAAKPSFDPIAAGFSDLVDWFNNGGPKPVFIGFGSMVIKEPAKLVAIITKAAELVGCRIVVQSGWTNLDVSNCAKAEDLPDLNLDFTGPLCHNVGRCPHDWLLPLCCAVVHHGGAGTTAAGLKFGLPTFVCPFFADQYMWSEMVARANVGPKPCPVNDLTVEILAERLKDLTSEETRNNAVALSKKMNEENGIEGGIKHFVESLPIDNMFCDVSMLLGEVKKALYRVVGPKLKVSVEVAAATELTTLSQAHFVYKFGNRASRLEPLDVFDYDVAGHIRSVPHGCLHGCTGFFINFFEAIISCFTAPNNLALKFGMFGCIFGVLWFPFQMLFKFLYSILYFLDAVLVGIHNTYGRHKRRYLINPWVAKESHVNLLPHINSALQSYLDDGIDEIRFSLLLTALEAVTEARAVFNKCKYEYSPMLRCYEVSVVELLLKLDDLKINNKLFLSNDEKEKAKQDILEKNLEKITFSRFIHILRTSVGERILRRKRLRNRESVRSLNESGKKLNDVGKDEYDVTSLRTPIITEDVESVDSRRIKQNDLLKSHESRMMIKEMSVRGF